MDTAIIVAALSLAGTVIVALIGLIVTLTTSRERTKTAAEEAATITAEKAQEDKEEALRERLLLRDEQLDICRREKARLHKELNSLREGKP